MNPAVPTPGRSRWLALVVLCAGMTMVILDQTIVTVALPAIQRSLGFSQPGLAWVVNAYLIAFGGVLLLAGRLGDLVGGKRVFMTGLVIFTVASVLCGAADSQLMLIAARFAQGLGGAMATAAGLGMIVRAFPAQPEQGRAMGAYSFVGAGGASAGLVLGGVLTQALGWHWIFFVNAPVGAVTIAAGARLLESGRGAGIRAGADVVGAVAATAGIMLAVYTIAGTSRYGWGSAHTLGIAAASAALLAGFVARQATAATPLLPLRLFRSRSVSGANLVQALTVAALFGFQFLIALYLQHVLGYSAAETGVAMLPTAAAIGVVSIGASARLNARFGERAMLIAGLVCVMTALVLLTRAPVRGAYLTDVLPSLVAIGGFGLALPAMMTLALSAATPADAGLASGLANTTQQVGGALGLAVLAALATARTGHLLAAGQRPAAALTGGYHLAFGIGAALVAGAIVVAATVLRPAGPLLPAQAGHEPAAAAVAMDNECDGAASCDHR